MPTETDQLGRQLAALDERTVHIAKKLDGLCAMLTGNGRDGMVQRVAKLEVTARWVWVAVAGITGSVITAVGAQTLAP